MDIVMGFAAALFWGGTDFLVGVNARAIGVKRSVFLGQMLGCTILSALLLLYPIFLTPFKYSSVKIWLFAGVAAICTVLGALALSKALALGKAAIIAPIITSYGVFTTILSWLSGEIIGYGQWFGLVICFGGVVLSSLVGKGVNENIKTNRVAVFLGLLAASLYGMSFWLQGKYTLPELGAVTMLWVNYTVGALFSLIIFMRVEPCFGMLSFKCVSSLMCVSLLNLGGFAAFSMGAVNGSLSVVTVISTLSGGVAAILGFVFFKERVRPVQLMGIVLVLVGAVLLNALK